MPVVPVSDPMSATQPSSTPMTQSTNSAPSQTNMMMALATMKDLGRIGQTKDSMPKLPKRKGK